MTNAGTMNISSGQQLEASGLLNSGMVNLNGGAISVPYGSIQNAAGGTIRGEGTIAGPLTNQGLIDACGVNMLALTQFSGNQPSGELRVENGSTLQVLGGGGETWSGPQAGGGPPAPFTNLGLIALKGPNAAMNGDQIINRGTIQGQGRVSNTVSNIATIRADGGQLNFFGSGNENYGTIECPAGGTVAFFQSLTGNYGLIALDGGAFNHTNAPFTNHGPIRGHGTLRTARLDNFNNITFSEGDNSIFGIVTNEVSANIYNYGNTSSLTTFFDAVINLAGAHIGVKGGTVRFLGPFTNSGLYDTDPADNYFSDLDVTSTGVVSGGAGDRFFINGNFTNAGQLNLGGGSTTTVKNGTGDLVQTGGSFSVGSGATIAAGMLNISGGTISATDSTALVTASLNYTSPVNSTFNGIIAGAGRTVTLNNPAATLTLSAKNTYSGVTTVIDGILEIAGGIDASGTSLIDVQSGTAILKTVNVNKPNLNISTAALATFEVVNGAHVVGAISGSGITKIDANASLTVTSIFQDTLSMGSGAKLIIQAIPGGLQGGKITPVPEPSGFALLAGAFILAIFAGSKKRIAPKL